MTQQEFFNRYTYSVKTDRIGGGGFGTVYRATDKLLHRKVAIKVSEVKFFGDKEFSLKAEFDAVGKLPPHPNIAHYEELYSFESPQGVFDYAIMQYYEDGNLKNLLGQGGLTLAQKEQIARGILDGIAFLHSNKVVHRDLKPANILICREGDGYIPLITDFGLSKGVDEMSKSGFTNSIAGAGSLGYMSPEQFKNSRIQLNTDLWSYGVIVYELFSGRRLFQSALQTGASAEVQDMILHKDISQEIASLPDRWSKVAGRCLVRDNKLRAKSADELFGIINDDGDTTPVVISDEDEDTVIETPQEPKSVTPPKPKPTPKPIKKWPFIVGAATLAVVAALVVMLTSKAEIHTFEDLKAHAADEFKAKQLIGIGDSYYNGAEGYPQDYAEATFWYRRAANQGKSSAKDKLKACQEMGYGVTPQSKKELKSIIAERMEKHGPNCNLNDIDVSKVTDMDSLFFESQFNGDISKWNVSNVTDMQAMFYHSQFNGDISKWDVSNVTDMIGMFNSSQFNGDISKWNVSNVEVMNAMFWGSQFNGDISKWNVSNVEVMSAMFWGSQFNGDISKWDVSKVTNMYWMFRGSPFNGDISKWNVSNVTDMQAMFDQSPFNGDISKWDVSNVTDMMGMFNSSQFNGDISKWDVSNVTDMSYMFGHSPFNGDISKWDVSKVTNMSYMFGHSPFNGDISKWDVSKVTEMGGMFVGSPLEGREPSWYRE